MTSIVTPTEVVEQFIDVLQRRHGDHFGAYYRDRDAEAPKAPTFDHLMAPGKRHKDQPAPCVLLGVVNVAEDPERDEQDDRMKFVWQLLVEVWVEGRSRVDVLRRRDAIFMTVLECIFDRVPAHGEPIDLIEFGALQSDDLPDAAAGYVGVTSFTLDVTVAGSLQLGRFPVDDTDLPPGTPGGPPAPGQDPVPLPGVTSITDDIDREQPE